MTTQDDSRLTTSDLADPAPDRAVGPTTADDRTRADSERAGQTPPGAEGMDERRAKASSLAPEEPTLGSSPDMTLFPQEQADGFRERWAQLQAHFVDDPQEAVRGSDALVAEVMQTLAASFATHKSNLEGQWKAGDAPTEDLRQAFQRYRAFFDRLLSA